MSWRSTAAFALCCLPGGLIVASILSNELGPDPFQTLIHSTGEWTLRLLVLVLLARPLAFYGCPLLFRYRRMLGNFAFFYACLHLLIFAQGYIGWSSAILAEELAERPYVMVGFAAWLLMLPLAVTSTHGMRRRLGRNWKRLHRAVYAVAVLGTLHLLWLARTDIGEALLYGGVFALLLGWRIRKPVIKVLQSRNRFG